MIGQARHIYEFGPFCLIPEERQLLRDGQLVPLTPKAFDLLVVLVENSGHLIGKSDANLDNLRQESRFVTLMAKLGRQWEYYRTILLG